MGLFETASRQIAVILNGRQTRIGSFPVGIEPRGFQRLARRNVRSPLAKDLVTNLDGRDLAIGVDRLDYSKGRSCVSMLSTFPYESQQMDRQADILADHPEIQLRNSRICRIGGGIKTVYDPAARPLAIVWVLHGSRDVRAILSCETKQ